MSFFFHLKVLFPFRKKRSSSFSRATLSYQSFLSNSNHLFQVLGGGRHRLWKHVLILHQQIKSNSGWSLEFQKKSLWEPDRWLIFFLNHSFFAKLHRQLFLAKGSKVKVSVLLTECEGVLWGFQLCLTSFFCRLESGFAPGIPAEYWEDGEKKGDAT